MKLSAIFTTVVMAVLAATPLAAACRTDLDCKQMCSECSNGACVHRPGCH